MAGVGGSRCECVTSASEREAAADVVALRDCVKLVTAVIDKTFYPGNNNDMSRQGWRISDEDLRVLCTSLANIRRGRR